MVQITHCGENNEKLERILTAAQKRFALYGLEKTAMREIADDVNMSKAALYYYFQDKNELFHAVIEKEQELYFVLLHATMKEIQDPSEKLKAYVKIRNEYMRKFMNLSKLRYESFLELKPLLADIFKILKERELDLLSNILEEGNTQGLFYVKDIRQTTEVFMEILISLRWRLYHKNITINVESDVFAETEQHMRHFLDIFIRGIKCN
jgi:AcrR family transcriptional regulator